MKRPALIVFDLAGTTVNDKKDVHRILQSVFKKIHIRISIAEANEVMGIPKPEAITILLKKYKYPYISDLFVQEMHAHFIKKMSDFYLHHESVREKEGASDIFQWCIDNQIKIALDTGFDRSIVTPLLERMGWEKRGLIDVTVTSDEVKRGRPFPDMIHRAMEITGVTDATSVAKVGDTIFDLQEGSEAGCGWVIGITSGAYTRDQLIQGPHTHLVDHLSELKAILSFSKSKHMLF